MQKMVEVGEVGAIPKHALFSEWHPSDTLDALSREKQNVNQLRTKNLR